MLLPTKTPLPLNEFVNPKDEMLIDEDSDIFTLVVKHYSVNRVGEERDSNSSKEEVKDVNTTTALQYLEQIKL